MRSVIASAADSDDPYTLNEYLNDIEKGIWGELSSHVPINIYRRNLQKMYIDKLELLIKPAKLNSISTGMFQIFEPDTDESDVQSVVRADLRDLERQIKIALPFEKDEMTIYHLKDVVVRIDKILTVKD